MSLNELMILAPRSGRRQKAREQGKLPGSAKPYGSPAYKPSPPNGLASSKAFQGARAEVSEVRIMFHGPHAYELTQTPEGITTRLLNPIEAARARARYWESHGYYPEDQNTVAAIQRRQRDANESIRSAIEDNTFSKAILQGDRQLPTWAKVIQSASVPLGSPADSIRQIKDFAQGAQSLMSEAEMMTSKDASPLQRVGAAGNIARDIWINTGMPGLNKGLEVGWARLPAPLKSKFASIAARMTKQLRRTVTAEEAYRLVNESQGTRYAKPTRSPITPNNASERVAIRPSVKASPAGSPSRLPTKVTKPVFFDAQGNPRYLSLQQQALLDELAKTQQVKNPSQDLRLGSSVRSTRPSRIGSKESDVRVRSILEPEVHPEIPRPHGQGGREVSTRVPTGQWPIDYGDRILTSDLGDVIPGSDFAQKLLHTMRAGDPMLANARSLDEVVQILKDNNLLVYDSAPAVIKQHSRDWFVGANRIANDWARRFGKSLEQLGGMLAVFSPESHWYANVSRVERVADVLTHHQNTVWDRDMTQMAVTKLRRIFGDAEIERLQGRRLGDLVSPQDKALWIRAFDEARNPRHLRVVTPDGRFGDFLVNQDGRMAEMPWGPTDQIARAVDIWENGSMENISKRLGNEHKIRNMYNNVVNPDSDLGHFTVDAHIASASHTTPLARNDQRVQAIFGRAPSQANSGYSGTYAVYHQAGVEAARELGFNPGELQSINWESVRSLFSGKSAQKQAAVKRIRADYVAGRISTQQAWSHIIDLFGGSNTPSWASDIGKTARATSSYK